jgi:hydrogenase small subunit
VEWTFVGCSSNNFWDNDPFYARMPNIPVPNVIADADKVGLVAAGALTAGVLVHGGLSAIQHNRHHKDDAHEPENEKVNDKE